MIEEIRPDFFRLEIPLPGNPLKSLNAYVIRSTPRNLLIDTGFDRPECHQAMRSGLDRLGVDLAETDFYITHFHTDHFGLLPRLLTGSGKIYFNRPERDRLKNGNGWKRRIAFASRNGFPQPELQQALASHPGFKFEYQWVNHTTILSDGDPVKIGPYNFICTSTPGHSPGHLCLYEPETKILVAGDHLLDDITPYIACWVDDENPLATYLGSLDKVSALEIDLALTGHRKFITEVKTRITQLKRHYENRLKETLSCCRRGPQTGYQIATQLSWKIAAESWAEFPPAQKWFAVGEALAHLRYLEKAGALSRVDQGGLTRFEVLRAPESSGGPMIPAA